MQTALYVAAFLLVAVGIAHSYLGERYVLMRLSRREGLPKLFGSQQGMIRTLRFAWHVTTIAWWGFAAMAIVVAHPPIASRDVGLVIGCTFLVHAAIVLIASRGRHLSWPVFLAIGIIVIYATRN